VVFCDVRAERPTLCEISAPFAIRILVTESLSAMTAATHKWIAGFTRLRAARPIHAPTVVSLFLAPNALNVVVTLVLV